jgi:nucleotide-binding universal stress UspA family protein
MMNRILVTTDGSEKASAVVALGAELASRSGATVYLVHAMDGSRVINEARGFIESEHLDEKPKRVYAEQIAGRILNDARHDAWKYGATSTEPVVLLGNPAKEVIRFTRDHEIDMVVMGRNGIRNSRELYSRKVTDKIARTADCPCITVSL